MFEKNDKRRIYELIDMYLAQKIDEPTFCDEFYYSYDLELDYNTLTKDEFKIFHKLSSVASRFSEFEKDIEQYPGVYYTREELKKKVIETKKQLDKINK